MTLKFNGVLAVVEIHILALFHKAECNGSRVIVVAEKISKAKRCDDAENNSTVATADSH